MSMASPQVYRCFSAASSSARRRRFGMATVHSNPHLVGAVLGTQTFALCHNPSKPRRKTAHNPGLAPFEVRLSTSAGVTAGTGETEIVGGCGSSSRKSSVKRGSVSANDGGPTTDGSGSAGISERKPGANGGGAASTEGGGGLAVDARGLPRPRQRVEVELGTFHEFTAVNKNGGKIFEASQTLIPAKEAVVFPGIEVSNLAGDDSPAVAMKEVNFLSRVLGGRVTMVGVFHRQFGYSMLPSWTKPFEEVFGPPRLGEGGRKEKAAAPPVAVSLSLLESWPLRMLKPLLVSTMGRGMSPEEKSAFFYRFGPTEEVRKALGIANRLTLYVLLVDQKGRVRWKGTGKSTPEEVESLIRCAHQLAAENGRGSRETSDGEAATPGKVNAVPRSRERKRWKR